MNKDALAHVKTVGSIVFIGAIAFLTAAIAAPPEDADPSLEPWFRGLSASDGTPCCAIADCRRTTSRLTAEGYEAFIDDHSMILVRGASADDSLTGGIINPLTCSLFGAPGQLPPLAVARARPDNLLAAS